MINEAAFIKMEGVSDIAGIDAAMKLGANHPMGPLELGDFIGLDICLAIMDVLYKETGDSKYRACPLIRKMVRGGNLGAKSGKGFYVYNADRTKTRSMLSKINIYGGKLDHGFHFRQET